MKTISIKDLEKGMWDTSKLNPDQLEYLDKIFFNGTHYTEFAGVPGLNGTALYSSDTQWFYNHYAEAVTEKEQEYRRNCIEFCKYVFTVFVKSTLGLYCNLRYYTPHIEEYRTHEEAEEAYRDKEVEEPAETAEARGFMTQNIALDAIANEVDANLYKIYKDNWLFTLGLEEDYLKFLQIRADISACKANIEYIKRLNEHIRALLSNEEVIEYMSCHKDTEILKEMPMAREIHNAITRQLGNRVAFPNASGEVGKRYKIKK